MAFLARRLLSLLGCVLASSLSAQSVNEYEVKAAFLYNFAKFVEWPGQTFRSDKDSLKICVLGEDPFGSALRDTVSGKSLAGRSFAVTDITDVAEAPGCHILFISSSERKHLKSILAGHRMLGILTVGESEGFCAQGGVVNFKLDGGRVGFEINVDAAAQANLRVSAKVLSLAQIVKGGTQK
jgi:hypothetical protein